MRAVVTGGAGFIGSHVVDALLERGADVLVVDDFSTGRAENLRAAETSGRVRVARADICHSDAAAEIVSFKPDVVFHLAAQMNVRRSVAEPSFDAEKNVLGTVNLLESARKAGVHKFIFASTGGAIYGEQEQFPAPEEHRVQAECPYGVSKRCGELYLEFFSRFYNFAGVALRFANVYGPRQNAKGEAGVVAIFSERLLSDEPLTVNGDGNQTRDFIYVGDVVAANLAALAIETPGLTVFNVGRGIETSVNQLVDAMKDSWLELNGGKLKRDVVVNYGPALPGEQRRSVIDPGKLQRGLGWKGRMELREGLRLTIESFRRS